MTVPNPLHAPDSRPSVAKWSRTAAWTAITTAAGLGATGAYVAPDVLQTDASRLAKYETAIRLYETEARLAYQMELSIDSHSGMFRDATESSLEHQRNRVAKALELAQSLRPKAIE